jgi:Acetyltransferase (GNAT) domain
VSAPAATAELLEDRGEAAASGEFFRSRAFLDAEGVTHTLRIVSGEAELLAPLIVREIDDGPERDAVSPYGYPGLVEGEGSPGHARRSNSGEAPPGMPRTPPTLDPSTVDFSATGLVSVFVRHTLDEPLLSGTTKRNVVQIADPALSPKSRPSDRRQVRKNIEAGYELALVPGGETTEVQRAGFLDVYEQTMRRTGAAAHYFFGAAYFDRVLEADRTWLALAIAPGGELAAASLAAASDGYLHYYLSGSADSHLRDSPMKNVVARLADHAAELGLPLSLGGGISPGDALEEFKRGFANRQETWHTSEIICDPQKYAELSAGRNTGSFFPAYRA